MWFCVNFGAKFDIFDVTLFAPILVRNHFCKKTAMNAQHDGR